MCISPMNIINRSNHFDPVSDKFRMLVPCGKCAECRSLYQNEWFIRCYYEWLHSSKLTLFYTLTFDQDNLPTYYGIPCFEKRHVQLFLKRLRFRLDKKGIKLKYMITSEYGSLRGRPHYHALFFLDSVITGYSFMRLVQDCWPYGFIKPGDNYGIVNSANGIKYVTKYVSKDMTYMSAAHAEIRRRVASRYRNLYKYFAWRYSLPYDPSFLITYKDGLPYLGVPTNLQIKVQLISDLLYTFLTNLAAKANKLLRSLAPFHLQSTNLGVCAQHYITTDFKLPYMSDKGYKTCNLPRFIQRKLWYDCVPNDKDGKCNKFVLNDLGKEHFMLLLEPRIKKRYLDYSSLSHNALLFEDNDLYKYVNSYLTKDLFCDATSLYDFVRHSNCMLYNASICDSVLRGRLSALDGCILNDSTCIFDSIFDIASHHVWYYSFIDVGKIYKESPLALKKLDAALYDNLPVLQPYFLVADVFNAIASYVKFVSYKSDEHEDASCNLLRQINNPIL